MVEDRFIELETKLAHQEKMLDELNEVIIAQGKEIDALKDKTRIMKESMNQEPIKDSAEETPPPHY